MRIRSLKPGFFKNEQLCELSPWHRLCYEGLWLVADRDGRFEDRPKRLKAEIFPYDDLDMNSLLWDLMHAGFIVRYTAPNHQPLVWIPSWASHQFPRSDEVDSRYPPFTPGSERTSGTDVSTFPVVRPIETDPHLSSGGAATPQQIGDGGLDLGSGILGIGSSAAPAATRVAFRAQDLIDLWNAATKPPLPRCRELTDERRHRIRARIVKRPDLAEWRRAFEGIQSMPFYLGENDRHWVADFDYFIRNDTKLATVLERLATQVPEVAKYEWTCPHEPKCGGRRACQVLQALSVGRVS